MKPWYVQSNFMRHTGVEKLAAALTAEGIPFTDAPRLYGETLTEWPEGDFFLYGSTQLVADAYAQGKPVCYTPEAFNVKTWIANRQDMLNDDMVIMRAGDLRANCRYLSEAALEEGQDRHLFFRPLHDLKPFQAKVLSPEDYADVDKHLFGNYAVGDDVEVAAGPAHKIDAEVRLFFVSGRIVSASYYRKHNKPHLENIDGTPMFREFELLNWGRWIPHHNCVLDMAFSGDRWYALEFNCINASGFYDHNIEAIARALSKA